MPRRRRRRRSTPLPAARSPAGGPPGGGPAPPAPHATPRAAPHAAPRAAPPAAPQTARAAPAPAAGGDAGEQVWERAHLEQMMFALARDHAEAAARCARATPPDREGEQTHSLVSLLMSFLALEAFINMVGAGRGVPCPPVSALLGKVPAVRRPGSPSGSPTGRTARPPRAPPPSTPSGAGPPNGACTPLSPPAGRTGARRARQGVPGPPLHP